MTRSAFLILSAVWLVAPALPLLRAFGGKDHVDNLIVAMKFVTLPKGTFWMGWDDLEKKYTQVGIKQDFELAAYAVTQEQWEAVIGTNPSWFSRKGQGKDQVKDIADDDLKCLPVEQVSWKDVHEFLMKLNEQQKGKGWLYRLPSEAEWEYACRNASTTRKECSFDFYVDKPTNDLSSKQANMDGREPAGKATKGPILQRTTKVGSYAPNKLGLYDMHGNVWQWCSDLSDGTQDGSTGRVIRGGAWNRSGQECRAANRSVAALGDYSFSLGLRLARGPSGTNP